MTDINAQRVRPIGDADPAVLDAAYRLTKAKSEEDAVGILRDTPAALYPALVKHMRERPNLFSPEVHAAVAKGAAAPKLTAAEALFS